MPRLLPLAPRLPPKGLERRDRRARDPVARGHWQIVWLLARQADRRGGRRHRLLARLGARGGAVLPGRRPGWARRPPPGRPGRRALGRAQGGRLDGQAAGVRCGRAAGGESGCAASASRPGAPSPVRRAPTPPPDRRSTRGARCRGLPRRGRDALGAGRAPTRPPAGGARGLGAVWAAADRPRPVALPVAGHLSLRPPEHRTGLARSPADRLGAGVRAGPG